jgi:hypothetical protein
MAKRPSGFPAQRLWTGLTALAATVSEASCGRELPIESFLVVASVEVSPAQAALLPFHRLSLSATAFTGSGIPVSGRPVTWTSTRPEIAAVEQDGTVRGVGLGTSLISATVDGVAGNASVTVTWRAR